MSTAENSSSRMPAETFAPSFVDGRAVVVVPG
jgi:hypothetical protein